MNREQRRSINKSNEKRFPTKLTKLPKHLWPESSDETRTAVFVSKQHLVQMFDEGNGITRLSVNRIKLGGQSWSDRISWDELMQVKADVGCAGDWAVEIYPPKDHTVNVANMRHLWLLPEAPEFAWKKAGAPA